MSNIAKLIIKSELSARNMSHQELANSLEKIGYQETKSSIDCKLSRGTFSANFFLECLFSMDAKTIEISKFKDIIGMSSVQMELPELEIKNKPKVISLFSGCGGLDFGFHKAGYEIVYANDIEPSIELTYKYNLGPIEIKDIQDVNKASLPDCDIVIAGIPCQPFSTAGNRKSTSDSRGNLFVDVMEIVDLKRPKVVLFENVRGFLSAKDDDGVLMPERIRKELKNHGYLLHYKLLNASDYGVPQNRHRVVLVGIREDTNKEFIFPDPISGKENLTVNSVINRPFSEGYKEEVWNLSPQAQKMSQFIPEGGSWKAVPYEELPPRLKRIRDEMKKYRSPNFYRKFSRNEIMGTVTAAATPENSGILHPLEARRYSVREIARFQSFPDTFEFIGDSVPKKYKMIGNAVPCELAYNIALSIKKQIFTHTE